MDMVEAASARKVILFDAVGTLFYLTKGVGYHYALVGEGMGLLLDPAALDRAFGTAWHAMPARTTSGAPREDDDKGWWRELVDRVLDQAAPETRKLDRDAFFEAAYAHFAEAGVWELYPETVQVLDALQHRYRLAVVSNFDGRLRLVLEHLGIRKYFAVLAISSEVGAEKPDPLIYQRALDLCGASPNETLHVGDDPVRDWAGAAAAGISVVKLERPRIDLREVLVACGQS